MKFMFTIKPDKHTQPGTPPNPKLMEAIGKLGMEMTKAGKLLDTGGIEYGARCVRVLGAKGQLTTVDGPFAETKELIAGYAIFNCESKEEANEHARRFMQLHIDILGPSWEGETEIRQMFAPEFG